MAKQGTCSKLPGLSDWNSMFCVRARIRNSNRPLERSFACGPAVGHHGLGRLRRRAVDSSGKPLGVTGTDSELVEDGRIAKLYVILDPLERPHTSEAKIALPLNA
jgi:hypothetical protein